MTAAVKRLHLLSARLSLLVLRFLCRCGVKLKTRGPARFVGREPRKWCLAVATRHVGPAVIDCVPALYAEGM